MLHILLTILKILGIVILVILALILAIILVVLLVPIRYRINAAKQEEIDGKVRVSWLLGFVTFVASYREKKMDLQLRILGINLMKMLKKEKKPKKIKESKSKEQVQESAKTTESVEPTTVEPEATKVEEAAKETEVPKETVSKDKEKEKISLKEKLKNIINSVRDRIRKIKLTITNICGKIKYWKEFLANEKVKAALLLVKDKLIKIVKHILPKKLAGEVVYGFEDPCQTGQVLAGLSVFYPVYYKHIKVIPDFSGAVVKGNVKLRGRIYLGYLLITAVPIIFDKNIQFIIHTFRNKEESQDGK